MSTPTKLNSSMKHKAYKHYLPTIGMEIMNQEFIRAIVYDNPLHDWYTLYGMCHAIILLSDDKDTRKYYAELREYFFNKASTEGSCKVVQDTLKGRLT